MQKLMFSIDDEVALFAKQRSPVADCLNSCALLVTDMLTVKFIGIYGRRYRLIIILDMAQYLFLSFKLFFKYIYFRMFFILLEINACRH